MRDRINLKGIECFAYHGVYEEERINGQNFFVDATLFLDTREAGRSDNLSLSVDYAALAVFIKEYVEEHEFKLLETLAEGLARAILIKYHKAEKLVLTIHKPEAGIPVPFNDVSVTIERRWHEAYVAFGSSLGDKEGQINKALEELAGKADIYVHTVSDLMTSSPYGGVAKEEFVNGVVKIKTLLTPEELLSVLHDIEDSLGRTREIRWGDRTLDLDIIFYDKLVTEDEYLTIPHPDMKNRDFVLKPMAEIAPGLVHPVYLKTMRDMLTELTGRTK